jgi:hypothetical protein
MKEFFKDLIGYLAHHKKLWLLPIILVMLVLGLITVLAQNPATAPFIYTLF